MIPAQINTATSPSISRSKLFKSSSTKATTSLPLHFFYDCSKECKLGSNRTIVVTITLSSSSSHRHPFLWQCAAKEEIGLNSLSISCKTSSGAWLRSLLTTFDSVASALHGGPSLNSIAAANNFPSQLSWLLLPVDDSKTVYCPAASTTSLFLGSYYCHILHLRGCLFRRKKRKSP